MALNNRDRVGKAFEFLSEGLEDPVSDVMTRVFNTPDWPDAWARADQERYGTTLRTLSRQDVQVQLRAITEYGREFSDVLSRSQQAYASELRETRNRWAHMDAFSSDDTIRALSTIELLLNAVSAPDSAADVRKLRDDLQRTVYEDHTRKISQRKVLSIDPTQGMKPWRDVIRPHEDVATGSYSASEFAANLYQVAVSKESCDPGDAYGDPVEFFNRTYLTEGLKDLLTRAIRRLALDNTGSSVVNLQTNFGGGKTHSLLALYHLFGNEPVSGLSADVQNLVAGLGASWQPGRVHRAAVVGNFLNAGKASEKYDGTQVHTIWGELAWQLGGHEAYDMIADNDRNGKPPADLLIPLLRQYSPCLILIDEWVAYAKQLVGRDDLPAGTFDDQFVFAQSLTEAVSAVPNCMLVISIPASETGEQASDVEVGGENGHRALAALQNVVRRKADQWRPSTRDESFEIVRKRLFEEPDAEAQEQIALTARRFVDMYRKDPKLYPSDVTGVDYEKRIRASYPLHPELLDRLYEDWSGLENFQRTRGVLTLVSSIIHELWASNDTSPLILPGNVPLETESVNSNLTQYLRDPWKPIIDADVSGADSTAAKIDNDRPALGQRHLTQRIARAVFMGSAPRTAAQNPGISEQSVRLGTTIPGDQTGNFGTALSMLEQRSTYFFNTDARYRYDLQPSIGKTAREYAERLREDPEAVYNIIVERLQPEGERRNRGKFRRVCVTPSGSDGIADVDETTLVIVHPRWVVGKNEGETSETMHWIHAAIERRGPSQRVNRNMVVFLVADRGLIELAEDSARSYMGWKQIMESEVALNLTHQQVEQARKSLSGFSKALDDRLRNAYCWTVYPEQLDPQTAYKLVSLKVPDTGGDSMAQRAGTRLATEGQLTDIYDPGSMGYDIQLYLKSAFQNGAMTVKALWEYIVRFPYMPRLVDREVLDQAVENAVNSIMDVEGRFALASGRDPETGLFRNLIMPGVTGGNPTISIADSTLIVDWNTAAADRVAYKRELEESSKASPITTSTVTIIKDADNDGGTSSDTPVIITPAATAKPKTRYYASIGIDPDLPSKIISKINENILEQLRLSRAEISINLEISAVQPKGFNEGTIKGIKESSRGLDLHVSEFEEE